MFLAYLACYTNLPPIWSNSPPFCLAIGFESSRGQSLSGTEGKGVATFALGTTVGPQPRPASSTPGEPGRAADRQALASLSYPTHRHVLRNPQVGRPGFVVSMSIHPRTAVRSGRHKGLLLTGDHGFALAEQPPGVLHFGSPKGDYSFWFDGDDVLDRPQGESPGPCSIVYD